MNGAWRRRGWLLLIGAVYWAQPLSCLTTLNLEPLGPDDHLGIVDPHGFSALASFQIALVLFLPYIWLLTGSAHVGTDEQRLTGWRAAIVIAAVGMPGFVQIGYMSITPLSWGWPVFAACALWFVLVATLTLHRREDVPSPRSRLATRPFLAWGIAVVPATLTIGLAIYAAVWQ